MLSLPAKRAFLECPTQNVGVYMEHGLAAARPRVEYQPELTAGKFRRQGIRRRNELGEERRIAGGELHDVRVAVCLGHDEQVDRCLRRYVKMAL